MSIPVLRPREVQHLAQSHTARRGSTWPGAQVSAPISDSNHPSKWVTPCWFHSLLDVQAWCSYSSEGVPGEGWGVEGGVVWQGGRKNRECQLIQFSKCHVIPGVFSLCHHLHPPPACHLEDRLQSGWWGRAARPWSGGCVSALPPRTRGGVSTVLGARRPAF